MSTEYRFVKNFIAIPTDSSSFTINVPSTLIKDSDDSLITIAVNGQLIQKHTTEDSKTFSKYYFEVSKDISEYISNPTTPNVDEDCSLSITVFANQDFLAPGFDIGGSQSSLLKSSDVIFISFWYTLVRTM